MARENNHRASTTFASSIRSSARRITSTISPVKGELYSLADNDYHHGSFSTDRSSTSSRSSNVRARHASVSTASLPGFQEKQKTPVKSPRYESVSPLKVPKRKPLPTSPQKFAEATLTRAATASAALTNASTRQTMAGSGTMTMTPFAPSLRSEPSSKPPSTSHSSVSFGQGGGTASGPPPVLPNAPGTVHNPSTVYHHIQDMASKRISTLDYLRKGWVMPQSSLSDYLTESCNVGMRAACTGIIRYFSTRPI